MDHFGEAVAAGYDGGSGREFAPETIARTVDFLHAAAGGGAALEFGVGTGRIALPLARRGVPVHGIDLSPAMTERLRAKPGLPQDRNTVVFGTGPVGWAYTEYDTVTQRADCHYLRVTPDGRGTRRTIPFRYVWPAELDLMARLAGLEARGRWGGWTREPFTRDSRAHVSAWEKHA
ncbi:class I SAM-dependent methyltransferase [Streptomyces sp. NPDC047046]|uniref:class I SAM-dependent methyltransferase n=1 Tax=Streptomyces sp. NPDC047046 TaxID=3155378 RepID=UPI0033C103A8